jgi:predicted RNA-binding protein with PUA-like domain
MNYWLMKSEPSAFSIEDLERSVGQTTCWDGVRNYQARNFLRDQMKKGDRAFLYHSSCPVPGIVGTVRVVREAYPDPTAFDAAHPHFDADSDPAQPRWYMVDIALERKFSRVLTLEQLREHAEHELRDMLILKRGNRLSITPLSRGEWQCISALQR